MTTLILVHGWGLDRSYWDPLLPHLGAYEATILDFGYYGVPYLPDLPDHSLVIGHSLGALWALENISSPRALISLNGFSKFTKDESFEVGQPTRPLERMMQKLELKPQDVLEDFARLYGLTLPCFQKPHIQPLQEGLALLKGGDGRGALKKIPHRALAASEDPMISRPMTESLFAGPIFFEGASHDLLHTHESACVAEIIRALNTL